MKDNIPKAIKEGVLKIGEVSLPCAVLEDGTRLISERGVIKALGGKRGGAHWRRKKQDDSGANLPVYVSAKNVRDYIDDDFALALKSPIVYEAVRGPRGNGLEAKRFHEVCEVWLKARDAGALHHTQLHIAAQAEILMRGLAHVGIIALIDEATGYQADRGKDELQKILAAYINPELLPWAQRFPDDFYLHMFRLWKWPYPPVGQKVGAPKGPRYAGKLTKKLVYEKLPPGVIQELERVNPSNAKGQRKSKHHQHLTPEIGNPHLEKQVAVVTTLLRISANKREFERMFARAFPGGPVQIELFDDENDVIDV